MRYSVYKALNEITSSLIEATEYLKEHDNSINILADSLEVVLAVKTTLEANKEEVINEINDFFTKVNEISDCIENGTEYGSKIDQLYDYSVAIKKYCKDIKYKLRIVFFAELGSKWDSMDSVYWAYKNRKDCDVSVVIAPIYRAVRFPNGEIKSDVIYEDFLTNMGIEHIPFKEYDIKKDMPDMVFTSQPYESVTTEQFWAENIVPYTRLVYLPYFTSSGVVEDEKKHVQCQMPIHKLAWKIACQSEKAKEVCSKYSPVNGKNLVPLGLPKWDYVVNMKDREIKLPKEWEKLKGKKVILRNFHYNIKKFEELKNVIHSIMDRFNGTEIGILFRFHPLLETMYKVYHTEDRENWEKLKEEIEKSPNAVIDKNVTYDHAFKFSDILLTYTTSLIPQYLLTEKPVVTIFGDTLEKVKNIDLNADTFIKNTELYGGVTKAEAFSKCEEILLKGDTEYDKRMKLIEKYLPNSDGKIGERLSQYLIDEILKEDNLK